MKLTSEILERHPQAWVLVGLLIISTGIYLGFDHTAVFVYLGIGIVSILFGLALFVFQILDGPKRSKIRPLSRDFISIGATVIMPTPKADQEPTPSQ